MDGCCTLNVQQAEKMISLAFVTKCLQENKLPKLEDAPVDQMLLVAIDLMLLISGVGVGVHPRCTWV